MPDTDRSKPPLLPRGYKPQDAMGDIITVLMAVVTTKPGDPEAGDALGRLAAFGERLHRQSGAERTRPVDWRGLGTPHTDEDKGGA